MMLNPEYTVKKVEVWRVIGPDGQEVMSEDDAGREYPLDFESHELALQDATERMQGPMHGPKTQREQAMSDSFARMAKIVNQSYGDMFLRDLMKPLPFNTGKTIQFIRNEPNA